MKDDFWSSLRDREYLWVCHTCERIGSRQEAETHKEDKPGHEIQMLDIKTSNAIHDIWEEERAKRVAAFLEFGRTDFRGA